MSRNVFAAGLWLALGMASAAPAQAAPPNVVLIVSDDQGFWRLLVHGATRGSGRPTSIGWPPGA